jgi:hypothetical protein
MPKHALPLADFRSDPPTRQGSPLIGHEKQIGTETNRAATFSPKPQFSQSRKRGMAMSIGDRPGQELGFFLCVVGTCEWATAAF